jgi:4-hydroxy-4-methyl-2-oxoglutarate aldolase
MHHRLFRINMSSMERVPSTISDADRDELMQLGSATLGESGATALSPGIKPMWKGAQFSGPAATVVCAPGDNLAIHAAVASAMPGTVLAVSFAGDSVRGYWGEVLTTAAEAAGVIALVMDGHVRDIAAIERHGFPVFARGVALRGATKLGPGEVGGPIVLGGTMVHSGDWLVGDADGVVSIRPEGMAACRTAAAARAAKEARFFEQLQAGATTVGLLSLDVSSIRVASDA